MTDELLTKSFAKTASGLREYIERNCQLPNPDAGFSLFVRSQNSDASTRQKLLLQWPADANFKHPQALACFGFMVAINEDYEQTLQTHWSAACEAALARDLFPLDRQSFTFRPIEVLGIAYGISLLVGENSPLRSKYLDTVRNCQSQANNDAKSRWIYCFAESLVCENAPMPRIADAEIALDLACVVKWLSIGNSPWVSIDSDLAISVEDKILNDVAIGKFESQSIADATLLLTSLEHCVHRRLQSRLNETAIVPATDHDAVLLVERLCRNFPMFARQLQKRRKDVKQNGTKDRLPRPTIEMIDEYDVQDALHAILRLFFEDVRAEPWTPSYADNQNRIDFVLPDHKIAIEVKHTGIRLTQRHVADQLIIDSRYYRHETDYTHLICFVFDPELRLKNAVALEKDLASNDDGFRVSIVVCPQGK